MNRNSILRILIVITFCSCTTKNNLYLTRDRLPNNKVANIILAIDKENKAKVFVITRSNSELVVDEYPLDKKSKLLHESQEIKANLVSDSAIIIWKDMGYKLHKVKRKTKETTPDGFQNIISEYNIVWANQHQFTVHDLRKDSVCYIYRNHEKTPYEKRKWHLLSIANEYFLTFNDSSNEIPRIQIREGQLYQTNCHKVECIESQVRLEKKRKNR